MLIGIDGNEANTKNRVGVNVYAFDLFWSIYRLEKKRQKSDNPIKYTIYLKSNPLPDMPKETSFWKYKILPARKLWILTRLMPHLWFTKDRPDVFFTPSHYLPPLAPMPKICSIMDLGYLEFSGQFNKYDYWQLKLWSAISISVSKRIITISESSKRDIVRHYPSATGKISVTYPAYDRKKFKKDISLKDVRQILAKYSITQDYVLFLSTLKPSKNVEGLLEAFYELRKAFGKEFKQQLVIAGKRGWLYQPIFEKAKNLGLGRSVVFTGFVDEEDKPALIAGAKLFVLPSHWEGFGLDPLYAMAVGTPVVVSNKGSLPEVVGDAGLLVDPDNAKDISKKMESVLSTGKDEYNRLVEKGFRQAAKFSWEETAKETLGVLQKAAK